MITLDKVEYSEEHIIDTYLNMSIRELLFEYNVAEKALRIILDNEGAYTFACEYLDWLVSALQGIICDRLVFEYGISDEYSIDE